MHSVLWSSKIVGQSPFAAQATSYTSDSSLLGITGAPRTASPLTIVTTVTVERLPYLEAQCRSWPGPLVASLWVPLVHEDAFSTQLTPLSQKRLANAYEAAHALFMRWE